MSFHAEPEPGPVDSLFDWDETDVADDESLDDEIDLSELLDKERPTNA